MWGRVRNRTVPRHPPGRVMAGPGCSRSVKGRAHGEGVREIVPADDGDRATPKMRLGRCWTPEDCVDLPGPVPDTRMLGLPPAERRSSLFLTLLPPCRLPACLTAERVADPTAIVVDVDSWVDSP